MPWKILAIDKMVKTDTHGADVASKLGELVSPKEELANFRAGRPVSTCVGETSLLVCQADWQIRMSAPPWHAMPQTFDLVDAFTAEPFAGNPAAVYVLDRWPDDAWLESALRS